MTEFDDLMNAGLRETEAILPASIRIGNLEYAGIFSDLSLEDVARLGSNVENADASFIVRKAVLATKPATNAPAYIGSRRFKIVSVTDDTQAWTLILQGYNQ